jgi:hypothetical protein
VFSRDRRRTAVGCGTQDTKGIKHKKKKQNNASQQVLTLPGTLRSEVDYRSKMAGQEDSHFDDGYSVGETLLSRGETTVLSGDESIPDIQLLNLLCARAQAPKGTTEAARAQAEKSWEPVRDWLASHNLEEVRAAAEQRGESAMTALHCACKNVPPLDVIDVFLSVAVDTVRWPDSFEWLPLHYACACGAETDVIKLLAEAYPESKTTVDRRRRTPLHFALGNANPDTPASPDVVSLLSSSGAAKYADDNGMLVRSWS